MVNIKIISYYLIYITNHPFYGWFVILVRRKGMSKPPVKLGVDKSHLIEKERTS